VTPGGGGHGGGLGTGVTDVTGLIDTTTGHVTHQTPGGTGTPTNDVNTSDRTELAHTGSNAALLGAIGAAVLAAGAGLSMLARKGGDDDGTDEQADAPLTT
jgi:LPXTG-motif cell wall-anchored protein